jgi:hypothetical protein
MVSLRAPRNWGWLFAWAAAAALLSVSAMAQTNPEPQVIDLARLAAERPSVDRPLVLRAPNPDQRVRPIWTSKGLMLAQSEKLWGLGAVERPGTPTFDPQSQAWYATAQGCLVRLEPDGRMPVILEDMDAIDVDVRARRGIAVAREADDTIVLHRWAGKEHRRQVVLRGPQFFNPRFSPDGRKVLVAESRAGGGHIWLVGLDGKAQDLGQGYGATWHPDGKRVLFTRVANDGHTVTASEVRMMSLADRREWLVAATSGADSALDPVLSPDGAYLAYAAGTTGEARVIRFEDPQSKNGGR